jgi:hypothetical protein
LAPSVTNAVMMCSVPKAFVSVSGSASTHDAASCVV